MLAADERVIVYVRERVRQGRARSLRRLRGEAPAVAARRRSLGAVRPCATCGRDRRALLPELHGSAALPRPPGRRNPQRQRGRAGHASLVVSPHLPAAEQARRPPLRRGDRPLADDEGPCRDPLRSRAREDHDRPRGRTPLVRTRRGRVRARGDAPALSGRRRPVRALRRQAIAAPQHPRPDRGFRPGQAKRRHPAQAPPLRAERARPAAGGARRSLRRR